MSIFNPEPPDVQLPRAHSEPVQNFQLQSTAAIGIKTGSEVFDSGIKATDEIIKNFADEDLHNAIEPVVNDRIASLEATKAVVKMSNTDVLAGPKDPGDQNIPAELKNLPRVIDTLKDARAKGSISQTDFDGRLSMVAKDVRSKYPPGYRDYIDSIFSKAVNAMGANEYMRGLVGDINSYVSQAHAEREKVGNKILSAIGEDPSIADLYQSWKTGRADSNTVLQQLNKIQYNKTAQENEARTINLDNLRTEARKKEIERVATGQVSQMAVNDLASLNISSGADKDPDGYKLFTNLDEKSSTVLSTTINTHIPVLAATMAAKLKQPLSNADGTPQLDKEGKQIIPWNELGPDKAQKLINDNLEIHKLYVSTLTNKDAGPAHLAARLAQGYTDVATKGLYEDPRIGQVTLRMKALEQAWGSQTLATVAGTLLEGNANSKFRDYINDGLLKASTYEPKPTGTYPSASEDVRNLAAKGGSGKDVNTIFEYIKNINNPKFPDGLKANLVKYAFSDRALISQLENSGKYPIYNSLADLAPQIKKIGGEAWDIYAAWNRDTFGNELIKPDVLQMNGMNVPEGTKLIYTNDKGVPQFQVVDQHGRDLLYAKGTQFDASAKRSLNRINTSLKHMAIIPQLNGEDVDHYLYTELTNMGLASGKDMQGIPKAMKDAIFTSRKKVEEPTK